MSSENNVVGMERQADRLPKQDRYRLLVESIKDFAIYMLDEHGYIASWNPGAQRFKGYSSHEIIGNHFSQFYTEGDRAIGLPAHALSTAAAEGKYEGEGWRVRKDGSRFWAHVVIDPIHTPDGQLIGFAKITRDLTERKIAEAALRESEKQFRLLVQGVADYAIYLLDPDGKVSNWNSGAERIKGYLPSEIIGESFSKFYTAEEQALGLPAKNLDIARREGKFEGEGWRLRKSGEPFWASVVIDAVHDETGKLIGFAKITRDVTEKRETARALEQAREALFQSQKLEAIGQLTGGVAHDFNNLLMAILGSLELAGKRLPDDEKLQRFIGNAMDAARRGASLTQRMLAFARRTELTITPTDVGKLVSGMYDMLERALGPNYPIRTQIADDLTPGSADPNQLESALLNLALNARDAMPGGGPITIGVEMREAVASGDETLAPGQYVVLWLADEGEGMDDETIARAAEPFFTTKGVGKGTGLGLSMVQGHAHQFGGRLVLKSRKGAGTVAEIWLPAMSGADLTEAFIAPPAPIAPPRALTVLAVDDDALVLMNTVAMLEDMGHRVLQAFSAESALDLLRAQPGIDLIVTDQAMPGMTGLQLAETARALRPNLPVVIASGYAELPASAADSVLKLDKPFTQSQLAEIVSRAV